MKTAWLIVIVSALTDFFITAATGVMTAMSATGDVSFPSKATILVCALGGGIQAARTIQQALKSTPETSAALRGDQSVVETTTIAKTP